MLLTRLKVNKYWLISFVIILLTDIIRFPTLSFKSELTAETGTNYLAHALSGGFIENILTVDAGYLVLFPRLIAWLIYQIFPLVLFPYITNTFGLVFIAFSISFFNSIDFRSLIFSDRLRFLLTLVIGILLDPNYSSYQFFNFSYHGVIIATLIIFADIEKFSKCHFAIWSIFVALLCASKFHLILFLVPFMVEMVQSWHLNKKRFMFFVPAIVMMFFQITHTLAILHTDAFVQRYTDSNGMLFNLLGAISHGLLWYIQGFFPRYWLLALGMFILSLSVTVWLRKMCLLSDLQRKWLVVLNYVALAYISISCLATLKDVPISILGRQSVPLYRTGFITSEFIFVTLLFLAGKFIAGSGLLTFNGFQPGLSRNVAKHKIRFACWLLPLVLTVSAFATFHPTSATIDYYSGYRSLLAGIVDKLNLRSKFQIKDTLNVLTSRSEWLTYYPLLKDKSYFIPISPGRTDNFRDWSMVKGYRDLLQGIGIANGEIDTHQISRRGEAMKIVYFEGPTNSVFVVDAVDGEGKTLQTGKMINKPDGIYKYVLFDEDVTPAKLIIRSLSGNADLLKSRYVIMGN